jgi:photosystem I subunit 11
MGPFVKLGPLRSDIALFAGFLSTIGLIIILTLALTIYGVASFGQENQSHQMKMICKLKAWDQFKGGFLLVQVRGICIYLFIPTFTAS